MTITLEKQRYDQTDHNAVFLFLEQNILHI